MKLKKFFYTMGRVTICLVIKGGVAARGIAVCSLDDTFDEEEGRKWAFKYAMMGMGNSPQLGDIVNEQAAKVLAVERCPFVFKGERNPVLTWQELKMIRKAKFDPFYFSRQDATPYITINTKELIAKSCAECPGSFALPFISPTRRFRRGGCL